MKVQVVASMLVCMLSIASANPIGAWTETFFDNWLEGPTFPNWNIDVGTQYPGGSPNWGTGEVEVFSTAGLSINSANFLAITPVLNPDGSWTSGRMETKQNFACVEGGKLWIESLISLGDAPPAQQQGIWPAFWALGSAFRGNFQNWPMVSEWDILESINGEETMHATIHCGVDPGGPCHETTGITSSAAFSRGQTHKIVFQVDRSMTGPGNTGTWLDETLTWFLDDIQVFSVSGATVNDEAAWTQLAAMPHFLLLDVAVGGSFPNAIAGASTPTLETIGGSGVDMEVMYVGVWNSA
ncbi:unnamed protein product [Calypogeia fissa]